MNTTLRVGRIAGIPISIQAGVAVLALAFTVSLATQGFTRAAPDASPSTRFVFAGATVAVFLISILAHELGHATMARRHGVGVRGITLSLFGGYAQLDRQADTPKEEFWIAVAGPLVNVVFGIAFASLSVFVQRTGSTLGLAFAALVWLAAINVTLAVLNLLPAAPLDGGRVVTAILWRRSGDAEQSRVLSGRLGLILGGALVLGGVAQFWFAGLAGVVTLVVGVFLLQGARNEILSAVVRRRLARTTAGDVMVSNPPSVEDSLTIDQLSHLTASGLAGVALPVKRWGPDPIGYVVSQPPANVPEHTWTTIGTTMHRVSDVARAWTTEQLDHVIRRYEGRGDMVVVVHEPSNGQVVGTLSNHQIDPLLRPPDTWGRDRPVTASSP